MNLSDIFLNKNRLSSTTCGGNYKRLAKIVKKTKKVTNFKRFAFLTFLTSK